MVRITLADGSTIEIPENGSVEVENYPPSETPKPGYVRTREYPPEWRRFTTFRPNVLAAGQTIRTHRGIQEIAAVERID